MFFALLLSMIRIVFRDNSNVLFILFLTYSCCSLDINLISCPFSKDHVG